MQERLHGFLAVLGEGRHDLGAVLEVDAGSQAADERSRRAARELFGAVMNKRVVIDRDPVELPVLPGIDEQLWLALIELAELQKQTWTLIGGQMVLLHAIENDALPSRVSTDLDVVVNARVASSAVQKFVAALVARGFKVAGTSPEGIAHRYARDGVSVDVLAPEGLGEHAHLTTTPPGRTLQVPGGTQALKRTEMVPVKFRGHMGHVPRPSLLGAVTCKACAVDVDVSQATHPESPE